MCRKLLEELRDCNAKIDRELSDKEKLEILWEACILNRMALTRLMKAALALPDLTEERRVAFQAFLDETDIEDHPFLRSSDGKSEHHEE